MHFKGVLNAFHFDKDILFDNEVDAEGTVQWFIFVNDGQRDLPFELQMRRPELPGQAGLIDGLQQSGSCVSVHLDCASDDAFGDALESRKHGCANCKDPATAQIPDW